MRKWMRSNHYGSTCLYQEDVGGAEVVSGNVLETLIEELRKTNVLLSVIASRLETGTVGNVETTGAKLYTINQFIEKYPVFTEGGLRHNLFYRATNGLDDCEAVIKVGRKVLIDEAKFLIWVKGNPKTIVIPIKGTSK